MSPSPDATPRTRTTTGGVTRRPLPALIFLVALTLLASLVWWRVLTRSDHSGATACPTGTATVQLPDPSIVTLSVLNSTQRKGLAQTVAQQLVHSSFKLTGYGNDTNHVAVTGVAEIRYSPDERSSATLLGYFVPGATLVPLTGPAQGVLVLALGAKFKAVTAVSVARAAIARDKVKLSTTGVPLATTTATC